MDRFITRHRVVADIIFVLIIGALCILVAQHVSAIIENRHISRSEYSSTATWPKEIYPGETFTVTRMASGEKPDCTADITREFVSVSDPATNIKMPSSRRPTMTKPGMVKASMEIPPNIKPGFYIYLAHIKYDCGSLVDRVLGESSYDIPPILVDIKHPKE